MDFDFPDLPFELPDPIQGLVSAFLDGRFADVVTFFGGGPILSQLIDVNQLLEQVRDFWDGPDPE